MFGLGAFVSEIDAVEIYIFTYLSQILIYHLVPQCFSRWSKVISNVQGVDFVTTHFPFPFEK